MNGYLVPANTKKATLILSVLRPIDAFIVGGGIAISIIALIALSDYGTLATILSCIPMIVGLILVLPIPNYHNTLVAIQSVLKYYNGRKIYIWKGWCIYNEYKDK